MSPYASINKIFESATAKNGGIVKRRKENVDKASSYKYLLEEVKSRGFNMIEVGDYYVIICIKGKLNIIVSN